MVALLWLAVAVPAVGALSVSFTPRHARGLTVASAVAAAVPAWLLLSAAARGERLQSATTWLPAGDGLAVGLRLDPLSATLSATVATVGLGVLVYSVGYFGEDARRRSALAGLLAFLAAMQGLVLADGYLALLIFWELVGAASARLIAFNRDDREAAPAAVRAFLTTRTADVGFYLAVLGLFAATGSVAFTAERPDGALGAVVAVGLIVAAVGKSAQAPLQTWLMGAMAGPTPVSALLHSATMVAAGVYLLTRSHELLLGWPLALVGWIGALTAVAAAGIALAQDDLKRVLAGSTSSQLGLMFVGLAAGGPAVAVFHLVAHAAGKAAMFLAAGIFQHARGSTALEDLAGVGRDRRAGFACFLVGALSVAAVPPLAAFWSKEHIAAATEENVFWFALVLVATAGAAAYLLRPALLLWRRGSLRTSERRAPGYTPMLIGAAMFAVGSLAVGALGEPLGDLLGGTLPSSALSLALSLIALLVGGGAVLAGVGAPRRVVTAARSQFFVDDVIDRVAQRPVLALAHASSVVDDRVVDAAVDRVGTGTLRLAGANEVLERRGIDAAVDGLARVVGRSGGGARELQTGRLHEYLRDTALGAAALAVVIAVAAVF